jgi:hypothetical protein
MYKQGSEGAAPTAEEKPAEPGVVDAEFTEVKDDKKKSA